MCCLRWEAEKEREKEEVDVHNKSDQHGDGGMNGQNEKARDGDGTMMSAKATRSIREKC